MPWSHRPAASTRGAARFGGLPRRALILLVALAACSGAVQAEPSVPREERIKAVLIFKILKFVELARVGHGRQGSAGHLHDRRIADGRGPVRRGGPPDRRTPDSATQDFRIGRRRT